MQGTVSEPQFSHCGMGLILGALAPCPAQKTGAHQMAAVTMTVLLVAVINPRGGDIMQGYETFYTNLSSY